MSGRSVVWLTSRREILDRVRRRSFAVLTGLLCVVIVAAGVLASVLRDDDRTSYDVGVVAEASTLQRLEPALVSIGDSLDVDVAVQRLDDAAAARQALDDGDVDAVIDVDERTTLWKSDVGDELSGIVDNAWAVTSAAQAASDAGLSGDEVAAILSPEPLRDDVLEPDDDDLLGTLIGMGSAVLLFISITTFGNYVLTGVVEEKSTGVIEILLSHVRAHQLMAGKVFGIGTVALIQFAAAVVASMVALAISGVDVPNDIWVGLPVAVAWFIGGFLLYSTLFALAGSFVSRVEDAQSAAAPISTSFTVGYVLVFIFGYDPTGVPATVLSMIPPFAPLLMPLRMITGAAPVWQVIVAAVLLVLSIAGMIRLAGSVYARTLLHRGSRITWREAFKRRHDDTPIAA
jgi:ABC-2 type transport system permease protein